MKSNTGIKIFLVLASLAVSIVGFMIKLPSQFRHFDKELHALFYFVAAAFLNILFSNKNIAVHLAIFAVLYVFGMSIEHAQSWSNKFFHTRIHGRYDPEDVRCNLKGLMAFSAVWIVYVGLAFVWARMNLKEAVKQPEQ